MEIRTLFTPEALEVVESKERFMFFIADVLKSYKFEPVVENAFTEFAQGCKQELQTHLDDTFKDLFTVSVFDEQELPVGSYSSEIIILIDCIRTIH